MLFPGVRDRHDDNWVIMPDGSVVLIDFGFVFGNAPTLIDTGKIALDIQLFGAVGTLHFSSLVRIVAEGYRTIRRHADQVIYLPMNALLHHILLLFLLHLHVSQTICQSINR